MNTWQMTQHLVESPGAVDEQRGEFSFPALLPLETDPDTVDSFFQLVPPTPRYAQNITHPIPMHHSQGLASGLVQPLYIPPSPGLSEGYLESHYGLRSHRSSLSVGSIDSHISTPSAFSGQWSNISSTDSVADSDDLGHGHKRQVSLSIDPNLFRPKEKSPVPQPGLGEVVIADGGEVDEGDLLTAVPKKSKKPSKKKGTGMSAEERKKVSHARKVSGHHAVVHHWRPARGECAVSLTTQRQQQPDHIPRPRNAFILFRKHVVDSKLIPPSVEMRHQNVSIITAKMWSVVSANHHPVCGY